MADDDQNLDTNDSAQDDQTDQTDQTDQDQVDTDQADQIQKPFTPQQEQYMGSWMGRNIKKHVEDAIAPLIQGQQQQPIVDPPGDGGNLQTEFDEQVQADFFAGKTSKAIGDVLDVRERVKINIATNKKIEVDKAITALSDQPYYKDIHGEMKAIAHEAVANGYPPDAAVKLAYNQAKGDHLQRKMDGDNPGSGDLDRLPGGTRQSRQTKTKLAPEFKKACEEGIAKGLFKDEQEYINYLNPAIRQQYGM